MHPASGPVWAGNGLRGAPIVLVAAWCAVIAGAAGWCVLDLVTESEHSTTWLRVAELAVLSLVFGALAFRDGRLRQLIRSGPQPDMTSVWNFAAALTLAPGHAALLVAIVSLGVWFQWHRPTGQFGYRKIYSTAALMISAETASRIARHAGSWTHAPSTASAAGWILAALGVYTVLNRLIVSVGSALADGGAVGSALGSRLDNALEFATLFLGVMVAFVLVVQPWLVPVVLLPLGMIQRAALINQLEVAASRDPKTGLLNDVAWREAANRQLTMAARTEQSAAVLVIDLDHFKSVNDDFGHLVGDAALVAVGRELTREVRQSDLVGRFGGEEFVALLPRLGPTEATVAADRLRSAVAAIAVGVQQSPDRSPRPAGRITASIGLAVFPEHGATLEELLVAADAALYMAKRSGRDRVVVADGGSDGGRVDSVHV